MATLPSLLPSKPAIQDTTSTADEIKQPFGKNTTPEVTPIFICVLDRRCCECLLIHMFKCCLSECYRLMPSHKALMAHRKKDHQSEDETQVITWNEIEGPTPQS